MDYIYEINCSTTDTLPLILLNILSEVSRENRHLSSICDHHRPRLGCKHNKPLATFDVHQHNIYWVFDASVNSKNSAQPVHCTGWSAFLLFVLHLMESLSIKQHSSLCFYAKNRKIFWQKYSRYFWLQMRWSRFNFHVIATSSVQFNVSGRIHVQTFLDNLALWLKGCEWGGGGGSGIHYLLKI